MPIYHRRGLNIKQPAIEGIAINRLILTFVVIGAFLLAGAGTFFAYDRLFGPGSETAEQELTKLVNQPRSIAEPAVGQVASTPSTTINPNNRPGGPGWALDCKSKAKEKGMECRMSQTLVSKQSRQVLASVTFRLPNDTKKPEIVIRLPLGLYLPAGATYQIDGSNPQAIDFRACVRTGCYAQTPIASDVLAALKRGTQLTVGFQNLAQKPIRFSLSLDGFGQAYDRIEKQS